MKHIDQFLSYILVAFLFLACAMMVFLFTLPAMAADAAAVTIPVGDWIAASLGYARDIIIAAVIAGLGYVSRQLPAAAAAWIETMRIEQLLRRSIDYGIAMAEDAVKGREMTIPVANDVLRRAAEYAIDNAPSLAAKLGATLEAKLVARLSAHPDVKLPATASAKTLHGAQE